MTQKKTDGAPRTRTPEQRAATARRKIIKTPRLFDNETADRIITYLKAGSYLETAAAAAGISRTTLFDWLQFGRKEGANARLAKFVKEVDEVQAQAEIKNLALIQRAGEGGVWQAAAWFLERKFPGRWSNAQRNLGPDGGPVQVEHKDGVQDERERLMKMTTGELRKELEKYRADAENVANAEAG